MRFAGFIAFALLILFPGVSSAQPSADVLRSLKSGIPAERFEAAAELGRTGRMAHTPPLAALLADAEPSVRDAAYESLWKIWMRSGDSEIDSMMARGVEHMRAGRLDASIGIFGEMIRRKPTFAEAWNKRATALYMAKRYRESIADCVKVIELNPYHFGALSGMGLNYMGLDDFESALEAFRRTLKVLPHSKSTALYIEMLERALAQKRKKI